MDKKSKTVLFLSLSVLALLALFLLLKTTRWGWGYQEEITLSVIPQGMDVPTEEVVLKADGKMIFPLSPSRTTNFQGSFCIDGLCDYDSLGIYFLRWGEYGTGYGVFSDFPGQEEYLDFIFYFDDLGEKLVFVGPDDQEEDRTLYVVGVDTREEAQNMIFFQNHISN